MLDTLREAMEGIPVRLEAQVSLLLETVNSFFAAKGSNHRRLRECLQDFLDGLNHAKEPQVESCVSRYAEGYAKYFAPFMERHSYMMENYLVNHIFRAGFPFYNGPKLASNPLREYIFMCLEFSAIKGLLIGAAAHYRDAFSVEHVVKIVQSVVKALEHDCLVRRTINWEGLCDPISMAALLKN